MQADDLKAMNAKEWNNIPPPVQAHFIGYEKVIKRIIEHVNKCDLDFVVQHTQAEKFKEYLLGYDNAIFDTLKDRINKCYQVVDRKIRIQKGDMDSRYEKMF